MRIKCALIAALPQEVKMLAQQYNVTISGVGKVNAAIAASQILKFNSDIQLIINIGTVGSCQFPVSSIHRIGKFKDRDYVDNSLGLGHFFEAFNFSDDLQYLKIPHNDEITCASGDTFVNSLNDHNVVDMEAYGIARVCKQYNIPLLSIKYVTDGCELSSGFDWKKALNIAQQSLYEHFIEFENKLEITTQLESVK